MMQAECTLTAQWHQWRPHWQRLHAAVERPTFFLSTTWMDAWLEVFGAQLDCEFITFGEADDPRAICLLVNRRETTGPLHKSSLYLNTAGEPVGSPMLEHNTILCGASDVEGVAAELYEEMRQRTWDELFLNGVNREFAQTLENRFQGMTASWRSAPYVDLAQAQAEKPTYLETLSKNKRTQIRRSIKLYAARGELCIEAAADVEQALSWLDELQNMHQQAWSARGKPGAFATEPFRRFHQRLVSLGFAQGEIELLKVRAGDDVVGILYNFCHAGHISYYQSGFSYEDDNRLKPGLVCHTLAIQRAMDSGQHTYDFLAAANQDASYKDSLSNQSRELGWLSCTRPSARLSAYGLIQKVAQKLARQGSRTTS